MSTLGFRGLLAGFFIASLGLTAGASQGAAGWPAATPDAAAGEGPDWVGHLRARACAVTQGLSRHNERASAEQRRRDCERRHGLAD